METSFTLQPNAKAVFTPYSTHLRFSTGKVPGIDASKYDTAEFKGVPKVVQLPENNFESVAICACTSKPTTLFHFLNGIYLL